MMRHIARLRRWLQRSIEDFEENEAGAIPLFMGLSIMAIMGFAGLGIDSAGWYAEKRLTQNIADSAAIAATHVYLEQDRADGYQALMNNDANLAAFDNGYEEGANNYLQITELDTTGQDGLVPLVEAVVCHDVPAYFAGILIDFQPRVCARAVGGVYFTGTHCVIGLDTEERNTVYFTGSAEVTVACGIASNSNHDRSLVVDGNATIEAATATAVGNVVVKGSGVLNADDQLVSSNHPEADDPFAERIFPSTPVTCDSGPEGTDYGVGSGDSDSLAPALSGGSYKICGDVHIQGDLDLAPGTYYIDGGDLQVNAGASITCSTCSGEAGVTLVMTGSNPDDVGDVQINGGAVIDLTAPAADGHPFEGIVFYKDSIAAEDGVNRFNGGATMNLNGGIYIPTQEIEYSGNQDVAACNLLVARMIKFTGDVITFVRADEAECAPLGLGEYSATAQKIVVLVE